MRTLTQPATARNLTAWFVSMPPAPKIPWKKLLRAAAMEAISERSGEGDPGLRDLEEVSSWLDAAAASAAEEESLPLRTRLSTRRAQSQLRFATHDTTVAAPHPPQHPRVVRPLSGHPMKAILLLLLMFLAGGAPSFAQSCGEGVFLGRLSTNPYGKYGSPCSALSPNNPYATKAPILCGQK